jgi:hypothetical protein
MSTLRISNIEAKADISNPIINEKVKITNSSGRVLVQVDGSNAGITTVGINTTSTSFTVDNNQNFQFVGGLSSNSINTSSINNGPLAGTRNRIINGDMRIAQRGTSFAAIANATYSLDRWLWGQVGAMVCTVSQSSDVPNDTFQNSFKVDVTTVDSSIAAGDVAQIQQRIEGYNVRDLIGTTFTVSFWVKSPKTGVHCVSFRNAVADRSHVKEYTITTANTWEYKTITVTGGLITAGTWDWTDGVGLIMSFALAVGSTFHTTVDAWQTGNFIATSNQVNVMDNTANDFFLTGVNLEPGTVATPFERRSFGQELALCQRYYQHTIRTQVGGVTSSGIGLYSAVQLPVRMRAGPTLTQRSLSLVGSCTGITVSTAADYIDFVALNTSGGSGIASAVYAASAEL